MDPTAGKAKSGPVAALLIAAWTATATCAAAASAGETPDSRWPPFLSPPATFSQEIVTSVEQLWMAPTLTRTVRGLPARAPFELYATLVDTPEVVAGAARVLGVARYEVEPIGDGWYRATDNDGARGVWRVLAREPTRRVVLSRGEHSSGFLGDIAGSALSVMDFVPADDIVQPILTTRVYIENRVAATLARLLLPLFGRLADRKLGEGFVVTARVAEWAVGRPQEFCEWLAQEPVAPASRARVLAALADCRGGDRPPRLPHHRRVSPTASSSCWRENGLVSSLHAPFATSSWAASGSRPPVMSRRRPASLGYRATTLRENSRPLIPVK
jgi:hypothetical protein